LRVIPQNVGLCQRVLRAGYPQMRSGHIQSRSRAGALLTRSKAPSQGSARALFSTNILLNRGGRIMTRSAGRPRTLARLRGRTRSMRCYSLSPYLSHGYVYAKSHTLKPTGSFSSADSPIFQVPSTINRVYSLARPNDFNFSLNYASSFVLPLQGFWNSLIYVSISWPAFKSLWADLHSRICSWRIPCSVTNLQQSHVRRSSQSSGPALLSKYEHEENNRRSWLGLDPSS
jgi:hypothetical protein